MMPTHATLPARQCGTAEAERQLNAAYRAGRADALAEADAIAANAIVELRTLQVRCAIGQEPAEGLILFWTDARKRIAMLNEARTPPTPIWMGFDLARREEA